MTELTDQMLRLVQANAAAKLADLSNRYVHAQPSEREAIQDFRGSALILSFSETLRGQRRRQEARFIQPGRLSYIFSSRAVVSPGGKEVYESYNEFVVAIFCC